MVKNVKALKKLHYFHITYWGTNKKRESPAKFASLSLFVNPFPGGKGREKTSNHLKSHCKVVLSF
jgi:hypothetical protein